ncbi:MAG: phage tail tape measure protein [Gammaproteobacteria bacterium]|nr:phage tail tape measure protein [Gammaproteobacteria bacterium]
MSTRLEKLMFTVGLINQISGPVNQIMADIDELTRHTTAGFLRIGFGMAGLAGAGRVLDGLLDPVKEMQEALGEVKSLSVIDETLSKLENAGLRYSIKYGESAAEFVSASYDIQSAIDGLAGDDLSIFTNASAVLAKGTKSDVATITNYMGTMYGIFQETANEMGKAQWVEQLAGQTASAVKMFKTTGAEMSSAFSVLGAEAQSNGVALGEQLSILGTLQATMSGSEAGTKYKAFLSGVGKAQDALGLSFTDSHGRLLPMVDVLGAIKGKFGEIDTVAEGDVLKKAFGTGEAVSLIKLLMKNTDGLADSINELNHVTGMDKAIQMANDMTHSWDRMGAGITAVKIKIGTALLPVLNPLMNLMADGTETLVRWSVMFPNITRVIGLATVAVLGIVAAISLLTILGGVILLMKAASIGAGIGAVALKALSMGFLTATWGALKFGAALLLNPITWIVLGIVSLVGSLVWLSSNWGTAMGWITEKWQWFKGIIENNAFLSFVFAPLMAAAGIVGFMIDNFDKIPQWFEHFKNWLSGLNLFSIIGDGVDWLVDKINLIPGIDIGGGESLSVTAKNERDAIRASVPSLQRQAINKVPKGGLLNQISNATNNNGGANTNNLTVHTTQKVDAFFLENQLAMATS